MKKNKTQKGITLVALIITIVMLLILAGVTIPAIKKDGLITQTEGVANEYEIKQEKEDLQRLMVTTWQLEIQTKQNPDLKSFLEKHYGEGKVLENDDGSCILYLPSGNTCVIDESGNITWLEGKTLWHQVDPTDYGDYIDYAVDLNGDGQTNNDWKIFYKDDKNVFIIASDYLNSSLLPTQTEDGEETGIYKDETSDYGVTLSGSGLEVNQEIAEKFMWTFPSGSGWGSEDTLLIEDYWKSFASGIEGAIAVGTPTIEMWVASWNQKASALNDTTRTTLYTATGYSGHGVGVEENPTGVSGSVPNSDLLYFPHTSAFYNSQGYYTPSYPGTTTGGTGWILMIRYDGSFVSSKPFPSYGWAWSVRPVVCLPSDVLATETEGGELDSWSELSIAEY